MICYSGQPWQQNPGHSACGGPGNIITPVATLYVQLGFDYTARFHPTVEGNISLSLERMSRLELTQSTQYSLFRQSDC